MLVNMSATRNRNLDVGNGKENNIQLSHECGILGALSSSFVISKDTIAQAVLWVRNRSDARDSEMSRRNAVPRFNHVSVF